jgi:hypothetical protein
VLRDNRLAKPQKPTLKSIPLLQNPKETNHRKGEIPWEMYLPKRHKICNQPQDLNPKKEMRSEGKKIKTEIGQNLVEIRNPGQSLKTK